MEETISTTVEAPQEQTTSSVVENQTTGEILKQVQDDKNQSDATQEPEKVGEKTTENVEATDVAKEPEQKNWEQIAKDNQASFTRVSQELAELKKQIAGNKPKMVEQGKINPEFEQKYRFEVDNREYHTYDNLARQLEPEQRAEVENLLRDASRLYNPKNTNAYEQKMSQVKDYFRSDLVENIAKEKMQLMSQVKERFNQEILADKQERANKVADSIKAVPELCELVEPESENFSQDVFDIVKAVFDFTGDLNVDSTTKAIQKIKELGVKEYIAKQEAEKVKAKANVPDGPNVAQTGTIMPSREELIADYKNAVKKYGMEKVDAAIMKG